MPGFAYYGNANGYDIWENQYYIPMGFSYDYYITRSEYNALSEGSENAIGDRELAMLRAMVIEDDRVPYYEGILEHLPEDHARLQRGGLPAGLPGPGRALLLLLPIHQHRLHRPARLRQGTAHLLQRALRGGLERHRSTASPSPSSG